MTVKDPFNAPFGTIFGDHFTVADSNADGFSYIGKAEPIRNLELHPATHVLHYSSTCFEGLKAHRQPEGSDARVAIFRIDDHIERFRNSIKMIGLPVPSAELVHDMICHCVQATADVTPPSPGSLYIRPTAIGSEHNIGAAAYPSSATKVFVITSPVGDYFKGGIRPLSLLVETQAMRTAPHFGSIKSGANYVMAMGPTLEAKAKYGVDQILFATGGDTTETGATNFFIVTDDTIVTRNLDQTFLHGVTRRSILQLAKDTGYKVEERPIMVEELLEATKSAEMFLTGTAAAIAPVGELVHKGDKYQVRDGQPGPNTLKLRQLLVDIQTGVAEDVHGWTTPIL